LKIPHFTPTTLQANLVDDDQTLLLYNPDHAELTVVRLDGSFQRSFHSDPEIVRPFKDGLAVYHSVPDPLDPTGTISPTGVELFNFAKGTSWQVDQADLQFAGASTIIPSPDGRALLFTRVHELFLKRPGQPVQRVSDRIAEATWSPDGTRFFVT